MCYGPCRDNYALAYELLQELNLDSEKTEQD